LWDVEVEAVMVCRMWRLWLLGTGFFSLLDSLDELLPLLDVSLNENLFEFGGTG
jgi:hypothetical protein